MQVKYIEFNYSLFKICLSDKPLFYQLLKFKEAKVLVPPSSGNTKAHHFIHKNQPTLSVTACS